MMTKVKFILLLMPGFSLLSVGGFLDKLRFSGDDEDYGRQLSCCWTLTSLAEGPVQASCGALLLPDKPLGELALSKDTCDYFVIFGGNRPSQVLSEVSLYKPFLRRLRQRHIPLVSIDNAAFLLAGSGIVKEHILVHWRHYREFQEAFPSITPLTDKNVMEDGSVYSCPGGNAAIELAAFLLEKQLSRDRAIKGLSDMLVAGFAPPSTLTWRDPELQNVPPAVRNALKIMRQHINGYLSAEDIARHCGLSRRQLDRCLAREIGLTARQAYMEMKFDHACWLMLRTSRTVSQIAADSGFTDAAHFSRQFRLRTGTTPAKWRTANTLNPA